MISTWWNKWLGAGRVGVRLQHGETQRHHQPRPHAVQGTGAADTGQHIHKLPGRGHRHTSTPHHDKAKQVSSCERLVIISPVQMR